MECETCLGLLKAIVKLKFKIKEIEKKIKNLTQNSQT